MDANLDLSQPLTQTGHAQRSRARDKESQQDTFWPCAINLSKVITGAGMMAIPRAFLLIGWLPGSLMLVGVALLTFFTLAVLIQGSAATHASTYGELVWRTCGRGCMRLLQLAVLLFCFGFSVVYLVVIRDVLLGEPGSCDGLLCEAFGPAANIDARLLIIAVAVLVCAPLLTLRSMDKLAALNAAGVAATVLLAVVSAALAATAAASGQAHPIPMLPQWGSLGHTRGEQWEALADVIPVILACYVAHQSLHPLMPLLKPYTQQRMLKVVAVALTISCTTFLMLAFGIGFAFGPCTDINALNNFSIEGLEPLWGWQAAVAFSWIVRGGYLLCILATLLLYMHPLRSCLAQMLWPQPESSMHELPDTGLPATVVEAAAAAAAAVEGDSSQQCLLASPDEQQQQQQHMVAHPRPQVSYAGGDQHIWQDLEQALYFPLTYGLLSAMVLAAVMVVNIYQAVSAVGDIASTMQAFIVPGVIALVLVVRARGQQKAAAAAVTSDVEVGGLASAGLALAAAVPVSIGSVMYAAAGCVVLLLGVALFSNGVYERLATFL